MNLILAASFFLICSIGTVAKADIFAVKSVDSFEQCLRQTHLVETVESGAKKQSQYLSKIDIQERCFQMASKYLKRTKDPKAVKSWIHVGFKHSHRDNSIDLIGILTKLDIKSCNNSKYYDVFLNILDGPASADQKSLYARGSNAIKHCLKNKSFKADFLEEQDATITTYRYKNVCSLLKSQGLIKSCLGA